MRDISGIYVGYMRDIYEVSMGYMRVEPVCDEADGLNKTMKSF
jgi:hypothetical protein